MLASLEEPAGACTLPAASPEASDASRQGRVSDTFSKAAQTRHLDGREDFDTDAAKAHDGCAKHGAHTSQVQREARLWRKGGEGGQGDGQNVMSPSSAKSSPATLEQVVAKKTALLAGVDDYVQHEPRELQSMCAKKNHHHSSSSSKHQGKKRGGDVGLGGALH